MQTIAHNHHFDASLRCACGVDWHAQQTNPQPCDSGWHRGMSYAQRNAEMMRKHQMGYTVPRLAVEYRMSETQVRAIRRKMEEAE